MAANGESFASSDGSKNDAIEPERPRSKGSMRSASSKIASLRAQFEREHTEGGDLPKKRMFSASDQGSRHELESELAKVKEQLKQESDVRTAFEEKCAGLEEDLERIRARTNGQANGTLQNGSVRGEDDSRQEVAVLQQQLADLKRNISTSTRIESQVTDSSFADQMGVLHHEIQNWVVNNFRRGKPSIDTSNLSDQALRSVDATGRDGVLELCKAFDTSIKVGIYQAIVIRLLLEVFNERYLYGVDREHEWYGQACSASDSLASVLPPAAYNKCRAVTFDQIRQSPDLAPSFEDAAQQLAAVVCEVMCAITEIENDEAKRASLAAIIRRTIALSHLFRVQRPQYDFILPPPGADFESATMEDAIMETAVESQGTIKYATFPAVIKVGDEQGENMHISGVVCNAKVVCSNG